jgi:hypothetical protein
MVQGDFDTAIEPKPVGLSRGQFRFVGQAFDGAGGNLVASPEPIRTPLIQQLMNGVLLGACGLMVTATGCNRCPQLATIVQGGNGPRRGVAPRVWLFGGSVDPVYTHDSVARGWTIRLSSRVQSERSRPMVPWVGGLGGASTWLHSPAGKSIPDLSTDRPPGLQASASLVGNVLRDRRSVPRGPVVLGGFSQGAIVASEVALRSQVRLFALVLLSGTLFHEPSWEVHFRQRRDLPVFIAHGRADVVLPLRPRSRFRQKLEAAGIPVTWCPFEGSHEIPAVVVAALNDFIQRLQISR